MSCFDIIRIYQYERRHCKCGDSWGEVGSLGWLVYGGMSIPIEINNDSFMKAFGDFDESLITKEGVGFIFESRIVRKSDRRARFFGKWPEEYKNIDNPNPFNPLTRKDIG